MMNLILTTVKTQLALTTHYVSASSLSIPKLRTRTASQIGSGNLVSQYGRSIYLIEAL